MPKDFAYRQLLTLIAARTQQWLRNRIDLMPQDATPEDRIGDLAEMISCSHICTGLRGTEAPLQTFLRGRFTSEFTDLFLSRFQSDTTDHIHHGGALLRCLPVDLRDGVALAATRSLADRLAASDAPDDALWAEVEAMLRRPIPQSRMDDRAVESFTAVLMLAYRFGAERPRFASPQTYGDAFATCLRMADWAQRGRRLVPLVQTIFCLCLIDPDHDVTPMLAEVIASQRPDGSFPARLGFGTADQDDTALRPTLATLVALHMAIHRRWRAPRPVLPMAA
ncbi:hypothetical protein [uncultured Paracoccus sp.]|uniref:hypothetical protein n=1 Tax=uncultured Paracoccus sp. TaxID=189685 RepID=UPI0025F3096C|nr:hypothetical protein [uncultured Paracoccus sp.]